MMEGYPPIRQVLPHEEHAVFLTELISHGDDTLECAAVLTEDCLFAEGERAGSWLGIEVMAQAIAAFAGYHAWLNEQPVKLGFLLGTRRYSASRSYLLLNERMHISVTRAFQGENGLAAFVCQIQANELLVNATLTVFQPDDVEAYLKDEGDDT